MPELPEVETVRQSLATNVLGKTITQVKLYYSGNIRQPEPDLFQEMLRGKTFLRIERRGKFIVFSLSEELILVVHLRMTGQLVYTNAREALGKHTHLVFQLSDGQELHYIDQRKFGTFDLVTCRELDGLQGLKQLGVEPLSPDFTARWLANALQNKYRPIKNFLLDQTMVAGIGNIYADEILFEAGLHPETMCKELTQLEIDKLQQATVNILRLGIRHRGTSIRNYVDGDGRQGGFQELLRVYGRQGEPCARCSVPILRTKLLGRGTYYCPNCQQHK